MNKTTVVIADDHQLVRDGIKSIIESDEELKVIAEADDGLQLLEILQVINPHVVLLDVDMPNFDGFAALERLKETSRHQIPVIMLTMHSEPSLVERAIELGARGFVLKSSNKEVLTLAIKQVASGEEYFAPRVLKAFTEPRNRITRKSELLTPREKTVAVEILNGLHTKEIANKLNISPRTVETHRSNMMKKLNVSHIAQLIHALAKEIN